ncbi:MAG: hypothetical protein QOJ32_427 [Frankiaceae bacterium]|nr:hypothetical protein [Frankiaceae bacterium]MDQ1648709.1 hypothetical protein [Frankiaceae bacterium]
MTRRRRDGQPSDDGSVTAEIALGLPTLLLVVVLGVHVLTATSTAARSADTAAVAARALGRGDTEVAVRRQVQTALPNAVLSVSRVPRDPAGPGRIAVTVRAPLPVPAALAWALGGTRTVTGRAVAVDEASLAFDVDDEVR